MTTQTVSYDPTAAAHAVDRDREAAGPGLPWPVLQHLHAVASEHLRSARYEHAIAPLARLALALPARHEAKPVIFATLVFAYRVCGRFKRARDAERSVRELCADAAERTRLIRAARSGSDRRASSFAGRTRCP